MHGEEPVEDLGRQRGRSRGRQLIPHGRRLEARDHEEHDPRRDVHDPELLVIHGGDPLVEHVGPAARSRAAGWLETGASIAAMLSVDSCLAATRALPGSRRRGRSAPPRAALPASGRRASSGRGV